MARGVDVADAALADPLAEQVRAHAALLDFAAQLGGREPGGERHEHRDDERAEDGAEHRAEHCERRVGLLGAHLDGDAQVVGRQPAPGAHDLGAMVGRIRLEQHAAPRDGRGRVARRGGGSAGHKGPKACFGGRVEHGVRKHVAQNVQ